VSMSASIDTDEIATASPPAVAADDRGVGVFGKLPALGDFVTRGLPASFTDIWHAWLVRGLADAREILGRRFEAAYMSAPVWRLAVPCGIAGPHSAAGILLPSVDAVGRLFPLTLVMTAATSIAFSDLLAGADWFDELEEAGRAALSEDLTVNAWFERLTGLAPPIDAATSTGAWRRRDAANRSAGLCARDLLADCSAREMTVLWS
jgi:type VI secretion system protein ImpM